MDKQSEKAENQEDNAWHKQPTVWIVLGVLAFTFISSFVLLYLAATNPPELINKNAAQDTAVNSLTKQPNE